MSEIAVLNQQSWKEAAFTLEQAFVDGSNYLNMSDKDFRYTVNAIHALLGIIEMSQIIKSKGESHE